MFSVWPLRGFDAGCQLVNIVSQNLRACPFEAPCRLVRTLLWPSATTCVSVWLHFGTPCYLRLGYVCWITLFTNKPMCGSHWSEPVVPTPTLTGVIK